MGNDSDVNGKGREGKSLEPLSIAVRRTGETSFRRSQLDVFGQVGRWTPSENAARFARPIIDVFAEVRIPSVAAIVVPIHIVRCIFMGHKLHYCGQRDPGTRTPI